MDEISNPIVQPRVGKLSLWSRIARLSGAFVTVVAAIAAGIAVMILFADEIEPTHPANVGAGLLAPMYRHWLEFVVAIWTTMLTVIPGYYVLFGAQTGVAVNWEVVRLFLLRLHMASGLIFLANLLIPILGGQILQTRDLVLPFVELICVSILSKSEWIDRQRRRWSK